MLYISTKIEHETDNESEAETQDTGGDGRKKD